ncbi:MAG: FMN-binding protein [Firmicutes bacterium]|nr:FMN-binding protein [Bacillota bacterium]
MKHLSKITFFAITAVLLLSMGVLAWNDGTYSGEAMGHNGPIKVEVSVADGLITNIAIIEHTETPYISDAGFEVINTIIAQQSLEVNAISGATVTSEAVIVAVQNALGLTDGVYAGEGEGFGGPIVLEVAVKDGQIADITIKSHSETPYLSDLAFEKIPAAIIAAQTTEVDTVSGATASSKGIIAAVENALGK